MAYHPRKTSQLVTLLAVRRFVVVDLIHVGALLALVDGGFSLVGGAAARPPALAALPALAAQPSPLRATLPASPSANLLHHLFTCASSCITTYNSIIT